MISMTESQAQRDAERIREHAPTLLAALQDLTLNITEAMRTGGWVPTPLHYSFWQAMSEATGAIELATGAHDESCYPKEQA